MYLHLILIQIGLLVYIAELKIVSVNLLLCTYTILFTDLLEFSIFLWARTKEVRLNGACVGARRGGWHQQYWLRSKKTESGPVRHILTQSLIYPKQNQFCLFTVFFFSFICFYIFITQKVNLFCSFFLTCAHIHFPSHRP